MALDTFTFTDPNDFQPFNTDAIEVLPSGAQLKAQVIAATFNNIVGSLTVNGNSFAKKNGPNRWDSSLMSVQSSLTAAVTEFKVASTQTFQVAGLSSVNPNGNYLNIEYGIYASAGVINITESGNQLAETFGDYTLTDSLKVQRIGSVVEYLKNGVVFYTSLIPSTGNLFFVAAVFSKDGGFSDVILSNISIPYPTDSPTLIRNLSVQATSINSFSQEVVEPPNTSVTWVSVVDGKQFWYDGTAWVESNGTSAESNTGDEVSAHIGTLNLSGGFSFKVFLNSNGVDTPVVFSRTIDITSFVPKAPDPNRVLIYGYVEDLIGVTPENFILTVTPTRPYFNGAATIPIAGIEVKPRVVEGASGYLQTALAETESTQTLIAFSASYTANGIYRQIIYNPVLIPNQSQIALNDLLSPIIG